MEDTQFKERALERMKRKYEEFRQSYGWQVKADPEGWARRFFEWGFTEGCEFMLEKMN